MKVQINEEKIAELLANPYSHGFIVVTNSKGYCSPALVFWNGSKLTMVGNRYGKSDTGTGAMPSNLIASDADEFNAYALSQALVHIHGVTKANNEEQDVYKVLLNLFHKLKNSTVNSVDSLASVVELVTYNKWSREDDEAIGVKALAIVTSFGVAKTESAVRQVGRGAAWTAATIALHNIEGIRGESDAQMAKAAKVLAKLTRDAGLKDPRQLFA